MALVYVDSFDTYGTAQLFAGRWNSQQLSGVGSSVAISAGTGRRSTASLRCTKGTSTGGRAAIYKTCAAQATWITGCSFTVRTGEPSGAYDILAWRDGGTTQVDLMLNVNRTISATRSGTVLGTTTAALTNGTAVYLEMALTIHPTTGSVVVRVNGVEVLSLTGVNTRATSNSFAAELQLGNARVNLPGLVDHDFDDLYICDGTGAAPYQTFLGDCRVDVLGPTSDGTVQQWTPSTPGTHYTLVDEMPPNTTDYVASSTVGHRDTYGMQDLTTVTGTIYAVQLSLAALKSDAGARAIKPLLLSGASEALGSATALGTSQTSTLHVQTTDPATGAAWTEASVNAAQCGAEVA